MADGAGPEYPDQVRPARLGGLRALLAKLRDPVIILPYLGYGTRERLRLSGRVLQDEGFRPTSDRERALAQPGRILQAHGKRRSARRAAARALRACGRRSDERPPGVLLASISRRARRPGGTTSRSSSCARRASRRSGACWCRRAGAQFGVVSDIDDTIVYSNVLQQVAHAAFDRAFERAHAQAVPGRGGVLPRAAPRA